MKNQKNKRTIVLSAILVGLMIVAYKVLFMAPGDDFSSTENSIESENVMRSLREVESINLNTNVANDPKIKTLENLNSPLPQLPIGKKNPFSVSSK